MHKYLLILASFLLAASQVYCQTFQVLEGYDSTSCGDTPVVVVATRLGVCYPQEDDFGGVDYYLDTCNSTAVKTSVYYETQCSGNPDETEIDVLSECQFQSDMDVSGVYSCANEVPVYKGSFVTQTYYSTLDCSGDFFYQLSYDYEYVGCMEGGRKLGCDENGLVAYLCDNLDCSGDCTVVGTSAAGSCEVDDLVPGTSSTMQCTSGASNVLVSVVLISACLMVFFM